MKNLFTLILLMASFYSNAQVICGTANEGGVVTLTAPPGNVFTTIEFASYGTPNGSCGSFTTGGCHAVNSANICAAAFVGQNSASINATNGVFGDPCGGTVKRLYIQARYSAVAPLTLTSFTATKIEKDKIKLDWSSDNEVNSSHFVIERGTNAVRFEATGSVAAKGSGRNNYSFINTIPNEAPSYYYRLKMVDLDGKHKYSNIIRINNDHSDLILSLSPNPAKNIITISSSKQQEAFIINSTGQLVKKIKLINGSQTINIAEWKSGIYYVKTENGSWKFFKE